MSSCDICLYFLQLSRFVPFRSSLWLVMGLKIKKQALERLLVGVLIFPPAKVSNMPGTTDIDSPGHICLLHRLIQRDGEKHQLVLLLFLLKSSHDFSLNPFAADRMFREDYQELIVQANRLINIVPKILTALQVLRSKPTTHAIALQVSIKPFSKVLILASRADKAGVVLDRMGHQGTHVGDEVLWNASPAQKGLGNLACGAVDGINANRRWISMLHYLKPFYGTQINVIELRPSYFCAAEIGTSEVRTTEIGAPQVSVPEIGSFQAGTTEVGITEVGLVKMCIAAVGNTEIGAAEVSISKVCTTEGSISKVHEDEAGTAKIGIAELRTHEIRTDEVCTYEIGMAEVGAAEDSLIEIGTPEVSITQVSITQVGAPALTLNEIATCDVGTCEVGIPQVSIPHVGITEVSTADAGITEVSIPQVGIPKVGIPEVGTSQVSTAEISAPQDGTPQVVMAEIAVAWIRVYLRMLLPPCIPNVPSLRHQVKLLSIYQVAHLLLVLTL